MLYDPKWETHHVKADPFTLDALIAWLEKQPRDQEYCYCSTGHCLLCQYFKASGYAEGEMSLGTSGFTIWDGEKLLRTVKYPDVFDDIACGELFTPGRHTFGGALKRARALSR